MNVFMILFICVSEGPPLRKDVGIVTITLPHYHNYS